MKDKEPKIYSYDWWWKKGREDYQKFSSPSYPKVKPYLDGWNSCEQENNDNWGSCDFINE